MADRRAVHAEHHVAAGKNVWLLGQALCIAFYFAGMLTAFDSVRHALNGIRSAPSVG